MKDITLRFTDDEMKILERASDFYGLEPSTMIKMIVFEKLEDDLDMMVFEGYEKDKLNGDLKTRPIADLWEELGL